MHVILAHESRVIRNWLRGAIAATRYAAAPSTDVQNGGDLLRSLKAGNDADTLVILDWNLPGMDVPTLLGYVGRRSILDRVSILLCVNEGEKTWAEQALRRGARGYILRPFTEDDLAAKIESLPRPKAEEAPQTGSGVLRTVTTAVRSQDELPSLLSLPSALISELFARTQRAHYEAGAPILNEGDPVLALSFVTSGEVEIGGCQTRGAGECFGEREFICGEPAKTAVRALSAVDVVAVPKESVVELARRQPVLQDFLTLLLTRRAAKDDGVSELEGTLASLPFSDLVQFLNSTRKTGVLILEEGGRRGRISFERGEATDARTGAEAGEAVFVELSGWSRARFEFRAGAVPATRTLFQSTMKLLMTCFAKTQASESADPLSLLSRVG